MEFMEYASEEIIAVRYEKKAADGRIWDSIIPSARMYPSTRWCPGRQPDEKREVLREVLREVFGKHLPLCNPDVQGVSEDLGR